MATDLKSATTVLLLLSALTRGLSAQSAGTGVIVVVADARTRAVVPEAEVTIRALDVRLRTDWMGRATFSNVKDGSYEVSVRRLGYAAAKRTLRAGTTDSVEMLFLLEPAAHPLPRVSVVDSGPGSLLSEFEHRRKTMFGRFITEKELRAAQGSRLSEIAMTKIPGIRLTNYPGGRVLVFSTRGTNTVSNTRRSSGLCQVVVFTDGMREPEGEASSIPFELLGGVEYYPPGYAPVQYRGSGQYSSRGEPVGGSPACGVMLLWSAR